MLVLQYAASEVQEDYEGMYNLLVVVVVVGRVQSEKIRFTSYLCKSE